MLQKISNNAFFASYRARGQSFAQDIEYMFTTWIETNQSSQ